MANNQKLNRDDLANFADALKTQNAINSAEVIRDRQNPAEQSAREALEQANVAEAVQAPRGAADRIVYCILLLSNGEYAVEESRIDRAQVGEDISFALKDEYPFKKYVKSGIISIVGVKNSQQEAVEYVINLKVEKAKRDKIIADRVTGDSK